MAKYKEYRKALFNGNRVSFETIKGARIPVKNSPYEFFKEKDSDILINVETGIQVGVLSYVESNIEFINHEVDQALKYFGNIQTLESEKMFSSWYWQFASEFKAIFNFSMPVDFCGLDVIKLDSFIQPKEDESTKEAILKKYGKSALDLVESILKTKPYFFYFYNPEYVEYIKG